MALLLTSGDLPEGFVYPFAFVRIVELGLIDLEPWQILVGDDLFARVSGLRERYPSRSYVPFARRQDNDDVACWDPEEADRRVVIVHDFASPGWERRDGFTDVTAWFRQAVEDLIEWGEYEERYR